MKFKLSKSQIVLVIFFTVVIIDQVVKIWVKTSMYLGEEFNIFGNWARIHFTENEGMAFGMQFGGSFGKLLLSSLRIAAIAGFFWYIFRTIKKNMPTGFIICLTLITAGAAGNLIDSAFYGLIFDDSYFKVATMFPPEGGYAGFLHGHVVDMFYFPIIKGTWPQWMPIWGGQYFEFFRPVFNVADSAITIGMISLILFHRKTLINDTNKKESEEANKSEDLSEISE